MTRPPIDRACVFFLLAYASSRSLTQQANECAVAVSLWDDYKNTYPRTVISTDQAQI